MAMLEKQLFDDGVGGGGGGIGHEIEFAAAAAAAGTTSKATAAGPSSPRHRKSTEREGCAECGTMPPAISSSKGFSQTATSDTTSQLSSGHLVPAYSDDHRGSRQTGAHSSTPLMNLEHRRSESPMLGMRGGLDGTGGASEPIRGLAAFGSQGSISDSTSSKMEASTNSGGGGGTRPSRRPGSSHATPEVCTCQQKSGQGRARADGGAGFGGAGYGGGGGGGSGQGELGNTNAFAGAPSSNGPSRGGLGAIGGGAGGGAKGSGGVPSRDPGYRVLQWSELSNMSYMTMGAMCEIYSAELDGVKVAVKVPRKDCEEPAVAEHDLEVELDVLKRVNHKHIIRLVGAGLREEKPNRFLVLEFLEMGTLADKLDAGSSEDGNGAHESTFLRRQKRTKRYQDFYMVTMLERSLELALALEHLHHHMPETFVVHRDLKPDNVGFKADGTLKLFDFGLARVVKRRNRVNARYEMTGETGSMRYMAPEVVESLPYNEKVDVYAFGLLLWEMLEDRRVFDGMGVTDFYERVVNAGARPNLDPSWPQDLRKLISQCWHADVDRRPNFRVITQRLKQLYNVEKQSSKLCMSALNLNEDEHPKLRGGSSVNMLARSATTTNVVSSRGRRGGPSSQTEIGNKKGVIRRSFSKMSRLFHSKKKGGAKATLTHTAPEAYARNSRGIVEPGGRDGSSATEYSNGPPSETGEDAIYGDRRRVVVDGGTEVMLSRARTEGAILRHSEQRRR